MPWNYRVVIEPAVDGEADIILAEVFYNQAGQPDSYTSNGAHVVTTRDEAPDNETARNILRATLQRMWMSLDQPLLRYPEDFYTSDPEIGVNGKL